MYKRIIALIVMVLFSISIPATVFCAGESDTEAGYRMQPLKDRLAVLTENDIQSAIKNYSDMKTHWSLQYVGKLSCLEIISGNGDGTFKPNNPLQADQFIKMVVRALGFKPADDPKNWSKPYIEIATQYGLVLKGDFSNYSKPILREDMALILIRAVLLFEPEPDSRYDKYVITKIGDYPYIADDIKQSVIKGYESGLFNGVNGKFNPKSKLTRAEGASVIIRLLDRKERTPVIPGPNDTLSIKDNRGNPIDIYPGDIGNLREYFDIAKAMKAAIPKAKGYVDMFYNPNNRMVFVNFYKDEAARKESVLNMIGGWEIEQDNPEYPDYRSYQLTVYDKDTYKNIFSDYSHEVIKAFVGTDSSRAVALHDKYMNLTTLDGKYEEIKLNKRAIDAANDGLSFSFSVTIINKK